MGVTVAQNHHHQGRTFNQQPSQAFHHQQQPQQQNHNRNSQYEQDRYHQPDTQQTQYEEQRQSSQQSNFQQQDKRSTTPIPILQWNKQQEHDGTYRARYYQISYNFLINVCQMKVSDEQFNLFLNIFISYETGNNIIAEESGYIKTIGTGDDQTEALVQQGSYSFMTPDGQLITTHYTADETGFHVSGDHIPTPPPVSEEIQKGLDLIYAGIRQQQVCV